jgi:FlaA1/EpsC-like NDP-sugar epimerase
MPFSSRKDNFKDLLLSPPAKADSRAGRTELEGKAVLVTGAAGSIGSELCGQILSCKPSELICIDHDESALFYLQMEIGDCPGTFFYVANAGSVSCMERVFAAHTIQVIFHAAAYKHVSLMEANPREALENNVFGMIRLLELAETSHCEAFVLISSDKAVNPVGVMGCTKRIGELLLSSRHDAPMRCFSLRFGNVLGSQGSVLRIFELQLEEDRPITITHPEVTRFFITADDAVALVIQAAAIGKHGDILVLEMGEPVRILDLARAMVQRSGKSPQEAKIVYTGLRPGEKLHEELYYPDESVRDTDCERIKQASNPRAEWGKLVYRLSEIRSSMYNLSDSELKSNLHALARGLIHPAQ